MHIKATIEREVNLTRAAFEKLNLSDPKTYADWLSQTFYFVSHTTRLLALAAGEAGLDQQAYHEQFLYHLKEEHGHEKLALNDLQALGQARTPERLETRLFYEREYALIREQGAVGLFGYMMFLETIAVHIGPDLWKTVSNAYGKKAGRFLALHAHEDVEHVEVTLKTLEGCSPSDRQLIVADLATSGANYRAILAAIAGVQAQPVAA